MPFTPLAIMEIVATEPDTLVPDRSPQCCVKFSFVKLTTAFELNVMAPFAERTFTAASHVPTPVDDVARFEVIEMPPPVDAKD